MTLKSQTNYIANLVERIFKGFFNNIKLIFELVFKLIHLFNDSMATIFNALPRKIKVLIIYTLIILAVNNFVDLKDLITSLF